MAANTVYSKPVMERTGYFQPSVSHEDEVRIAIADLTTGLEKDSTRLLDPAVLLKGIISIFKPLVFAVKVIVLLAFSSVYFVVCSVAGFIYLILYEKLFKTILVALRRKRNNSPYYFKWQKHHLDMNYEV
jgi:hypothetical protein